MSLTDDTKMTIILLLMFAFIGARLSENALTKTHHRLGFAAGRDAHDLATNNNGRCQIGNPAQNTGMKNVIELIANDADMNEVASTTYVVADEAFEIIQNDTGFLETVELMKQLAVAA